MSDPSQPVTPADGPRRRGRPSLPMPADRDLAAEHEVLMRWYKEREELINITGLARYAKELGHRLSPTIAKALLVPPQKPSTAKKPSSIRPLAHYFDAIYAVLEAKLNPETAGSLPGPIRRPAPLM